jgi:hypothetical protein
MPRQPESSREVLGSLIASNRPVIGEYLASVIGRGPRSEKAESDRRLFWTPALTLEEQAQLEATGTDPFEVSRQVYPWRWDALDKDGRTTIKDQAVWVARMTRLGPPEDLVRQPAPPAAPDPMGMTPPEPMPMPMMGGTDEPPEGSY